MEAVLISAASAQIANETPKEVYHSSKHATDGVFRKNWFEMSSLRYRSRFQDGLKHRLDYLISKYEQRSLTERPGVTLLHLLRIRAIVVAVCGLNSEYAKYIDEDVVSHPGWKDVDYHILMIAGKYSDCFWAYVNGKTTKGDELFDAADEMFGRFRHARWCAQNAKCVSNTIIHNFGNLEQ